MRFGWAAAFAFQLLVAPAWGAECDAQLPAPATLQGADAVKEYQPVLQLCTRGDSKFVAIRQMKLRGEDALLLADPQTLSTRLESKSCWACADMAEADLAETRMGQAIASSAEAPGLSHRTFLSNAGLTHSARGGGYFTADLCPSRKALDRDFLASLEGERATPVALSISGLWLLRHFPDYRWLLDQQARGRLAITWTNHTYTHPFHKGVAEDENFLLSPGVNADDEILKTERLLIANGGAPSLFFRFPGLVSSSTLMQAVRRHLISLGADAWLALGEKPHDGSIILVHVNGNEEQGLRIYRREAAEGRLPTPFKPLDEAP